VVRLDDSCFLKDPATGEIVRNRQGIPRLKPFQLTKTARKQPVISCITFPQTDDDDPDLLLVKQVREERRQVYQPKRAEITESTERIPALNDEGLLSLTALFKTMKRFFSF